LALIFQPIATCDGDRTTLPLRVQQDWTTGSASAADYRPNLSEGNYGLPGLLHGRRMEELAFAQGRGPSVVMEPSTFTLPTIHLMSYVIVAA
jgi:hypothetical protein